MKPLSNARAGEQFQRLVEIMAQLRAPGGCPWDREQTFDTIKSYLLEEAYEVMETIDARDWDGLRDELGDLLLQPVFFAQMAAEQGSFSIEESLKAINQKLVRRHPHVFADGDADTAAKVKERWDEIKSAEHKEKGRERKGLLDGIPRALPALMEAHQISVKAGGSGFDWENIDQVVEKLHEELQELREAENAQEREDEIGDLLFTVVNLARFLSVDPEQALRKTNRKFRQRFSHVEAKLAERGLTPKQATLADMEELWQEAKRRGQ